LWYKSAGAPSVRDGVLTPANRHAERHSERMRAAWEAKEMREIGLKRSVDQQMKRREAEREIKKSVLALLNWSSRAITGRHLSPRRRGRC
jgi:hypothetical protein